jgi:biotin operon repressor
MNTAPKKIHVSNAEIVTAWMHGYDNGYSSKDVAKFLGMSRGAVAWRVHDMRLQGVNLPKYQMVQDVDVELLNKLILDLTPKEEPPLRASNEKILRAWMEGYKKNWRVKRIAEKLGISSTLLRYRIAYIRREVEVPHLKSEMNTEFLKGVVEGAV